MAKSPAGGKTWTRKDLLALEPLAAAEIETVLDRAATYKKQLLKGSYCAKNPQLVSQSLAFIFTEPSTRTRSSFEVAARKLGVDVLSFSTTFSSLLKGESLLDTLKNLEAMGVNYFVIRHQESGVLEPLAPAVKSSLINAGDGAHEHPTQALLDLFTLREKKGCLKGLKIVIVGDISHSRVARSNLHALLKFGAKVTLCGPRDLVPGELARDGVALSHDPDEALRDADAVNVLRLQLERQKQNFVGSMDDYFKAYGLTAQRLARAKPDCLVLHPGPMNRGVEISSEVADGPQSVILEQVQNGVAVRMAVLALLNEAREAARRG